MLGERSLNPSESFSGRRTMYLFFSVVLVECEHNALDFKGFLHLYCFISANNIIKYHPINIFQRIDILIGNQS